MSFTSGLHGPRVRLTIPKTFDDFEEISVICFAQDNLESNFTPERRLDWYPGEACPISKSAEEIREDRRYVDF